MVSTEVALRTALVPGSSARRAGERSKLEQKGAPQRVQQQQSLHNSPILPLRFAGLSEACLKSKTPMQG